MIYLLLTVDFLQLFTQLSTYKQEIVYHAAFNLNL